MLLRQSILNIFYAHLYYYPTPINLTYFWGFGSLSGLFLVIQILTGIFLAMYYIPQIDLAFASIDYIMRDVNFGWLIRYMHANGASFFFLIVYLHIARTLYFGYFFYQRRFLWFSGIILFLLMMATAFLGYVLPWGQMSFWGATVITNLFTAIPLVGEPFALWLWGGYSVSGATLTRFFSLHYCLPFIIAAISGLHLILLHQDGSNNNFGILNLPDKISFYPYFYVKDYLGFLIIAFIFLSFVFYMPDLLNHSDNYIEANPLVTPTHIVPEWYFLPFYAILRSVPNKLGGVVAMALSICVYFLLPYGLRTIRSLFMMNRFFYSFLIWYFFGVVILLGILGGRPIEEPYVLVAQLLVFLYFIFFFCIIWLDNFFVELLNYQYWANKSQNLFINLFGTSLFIGASKLPTNRIKIYFFKASKFLNFKLFHLIDNFKKSSFLQWLLVCLVFTNDKNWLIVNILKQISLQIEKIFNITINRFRTNKHPYHLVTESPWPFLLAVAFFGFFLNVVGTLNHYITPFFGILIPFFLLLIVMFSWFIDIIKESTFEGEHTLKVQKGIKIGILLFIISEIMFFISFFWGFFHSSLAPAFEIGGIWPPVGIITFDPWGVPLINTLILLTSGVTVTWAHYAVQYSIVRNFMFLTDKRHMKYMKNKKFFHFYKLIQFYLFLNFKLSKIFFWKFLITNRKIGFNLKIWLIQIIFIINELVTTKNENFNINYLIFMHKTIVPKARFFFFTYIFLIVNYLTYLSSARIDALFALSLTILLGLLFTIIQGYEYLTASFSINDSIFGSTFFLTTGFHGLHVIVGTLFLLVMVIRLYYQHFTNYHHVGLEGAIWYWHFVDVVWLCLYISLYHWGA